MRSACVGAHVGLGLYITSLCSINNTPYTLLYTRYDDQTPIEERVLIMTWGTNEGAVTVIRILFFRRVESKGERVGLWYSERACKRAIARNDR